MDGFGVTSFKQAVNEEDSNDDFGFGEWYFRAESLSPYLDQADQGVSENAEMYCTVTVRCLQYAVVPDS
ncbi:hypothetical protein N7523_005753 [Penicillium sp. IBT 18751x]|nr:hypothetical protein N7523_005655 [Penicillium sp. IBT 18751x]KAJ6118002.1 hypothetical protein N7523_005753 [Penicillium sp. IBT 18751x]